MYCPPPVQAEVNPLFTGSASVTHVTTSPNIHTSVMVCMRDKVREVISCIGPASVGDRRKLSSLSELFFTCGDHTPSVTAKRKVEQVV